MMPILRTDNPRKPSDFYESPYGLIKAALETLPIAGATIIFDPGAGKGRWGQMARRDPRFANSTIIGQDIEHEAEEPFGPDIAYDVWSKKDFLLNDWQKNSFDLIIGNPPYSLDEEFIREAWTLLRRGGRIVFLLRLAFLEGQRRGKTFWKYYPLESVYTLSRRPSFTYNGKTDATAYAIFVWRKPEFLFPAKSYYKGHFLDWSYLSEDLDKRKAEELSAEAKVLKDNLLMLHGDMDDDANYPAS